MKWYKQTVRSADDKSILYLSGILYIADKTEVPDRNIGVPPACKSTSFPGSLGKSLVSAGHVPCPKLIARKGVVKVSNYKQLKT
jgi:hypothetical protein